MNFTITRNFLYMMASLVVVNIFGYAFHAFISRNLGPSLYAEYSVLYAFMIAMSRPLYSLGGASARVAVLGRNGGLDFAEIERFSLRLALTAALVIGAGTIMLFPVFRLFLKAGTLPLFSVIGLTLFLWSLNSVLKGLFTSIEAFGLLSLSTAMELFVRAVCGVALVASSLRVFGALAASAIGACTVLILLLMKGSQIAEAHDMRKQDVARPITQYDSVKIAGVVFLISLPTGFFFELDLLLSKRFFTPEEAGLFAAAALVGKGVLMFSTLASTVVYPKLVEERLSRKGLIAFLWSVCITLILFASGAALLKLFGASVIGLLFGSQFAGVVELAPLYTMALIPLALHLQVTNYKGAIGGWVEGVWLWIVLAAYYISLVTFSRDMHSYLVTIFVFHAIAAPLSLAILYFRQRLVAA